MSQVNIKILMVADGIFSFGPQTDDDNIFTLNFLIKSLQTKNGPLDPLNITVDTAHRDGEVLDIDQSGGDPQFTFPKPSFATIDGKFRFAGLPAQGEVTRNLRQYDQIWLFGYNGINPIVQDDGTIIGDKPDARWVGLNNAEVVAITSFMNQGGGVFASGDHASLGAPLCGKIPRVRTMRKWWHVLDTTKPTSGSFVANWPGAGPARADTLMPATTRNGDLFSTRWDTQNQSDDIPQVLHLTTIGQTHPILQTSSGPLAVFPDHMHEGEVCGFGGSRGAIPYSVTESLSYVGQAFAGSSEYPVIAPGPQRRRYRAEPQILATGESQGKHITTKSRPTGACLDPFHDDDKETVGIPVLNILSAYDGNAVGVGRVVTDSSFHHYLDLNLLGDPCADPSGTESETSGFRNTDVLPKMAQFYVNIARYLTGPPLFSMVCTGNTTDNHKVYCIEGNNSVSEYYLQRSILPPHFPSWSFRGIPNNAAIQGSALACWKSGNVDTRIYYFDSNRFVNESAYLGATPSWSNRTLARIQSRPDSGIACTGPNDSTPPRIYFVNSDGEITEFKKDPSSSGWIDSILPSPNATAGSALTAITSSDGAVIYYYSISGITEVAEIDGPEGWRFSIMATDGTPANSNIAVVSTPITQAFYVDNHFHRVCSLTLGGGKWNKTVLPGLARLEGSWLACYTRKGTEPVVYYVARDGIINELAWSAATKKWSNSVLPSAVVRSRSQICCLHFGEHAEVFYMDFEGQVNGLFWAAATGWENANLLWRPRFGFLPPLAGF